MKKLSLAGVFLLLVGIALMVLDRDVLKTEEDRLRDDATRLAAGSSSEVTLATEVRSLDRHHAIVNPAGELRLRGESSSTIRVQVEAVGEKTWGRSIAVRTRTRNGRPVSISNLEHVTPRLKILLPDDKSLVGRLATLHVTGSILYPTATIESSSFSVETEHFAQDIPVFVVATADELVRKQSAIEIAGGASLTIGLVAFLGVFLVALVRSLGNGSQASLALADREPDIEGQIKRGARFVHFQYAVSVVVMTFRRGSGVYYIPPGQSAFIAGLKWTVLTLVAGWWGIPWGPIYSIGALFNNLRGGADVTSQILASVRQRAAEAAAAIAVPPPLSPSAPPPLRG